MIVFSLTWKSLYIKSLFVLIQCTFYLTSTYILVSSISHIFYYKNTSFFHNKNNIYVLVLTTLINVHCIDKENSETIL